MRPLFEHLKESLNKTVVAEEGTPAVEKLVLRLLKVAPLILVQVIPLFVENCHWLEIPFSQFGEVSYKENGIDAQAGPAPTEDIVLPGEGVPEQLGTE